MLANRPIPRSHAAAFRGAVLISLAALAATVLALTLQYLQTVRYLEAEQRVRVDAEASSLLRRYESAGLPGVVSFLDAQRRTVRIYDFFYLLALPDGRPIAGNLLEWPTAIGQPGQYGFRVEAVSSQGRSRRWAEMRAVELGGGYRLLVGQLADAQIAARQRYLSSLVWSVLATLALGLGLGWWLSRRALRFLDTVSDAGERLLAGKLDERLPVSPRHDEYDRLAEIINACFADLERTVYSLRSATDAMAHDLKTPLTRIRARLALTRIRDADAASLRQAIADTEGDLALLLRSINDMLELARFEGTPVASFEPTDLATIAQGVAELYGPLAVEMGVQLQSSLAPAPVLGVPALLSRAVANLVDNALKHAPTGSCIQLQTESGDQSSLLSVADNGPGLSEDDRELLLRPNPSAKGFGLRLVQTIVRVHRGRLDLSDNRPGLCVRISLDSRPATDSVSARSGP